MEACPRPLPIRKARLEPRDLVGPHIAQMSEHEALQALLRLAEVEVQVQQELERKDVVQGDNFAAPQCSAVSWRPLENLDRRRLMQVVPVKGARPTALKL